MNLILYPTSMQISFQSSTALLNKLSCKTGAQLVIPMYRACSFPVLNLYQNITTHLHISHTCNFLPALTRRHQVLKYVPERDRRRGWSFLQEHPGWRPAAPREGAAVLGPDAFGSGSRLAVSNVKLHPGNKKASHCFSPLRSLLATTRKSSVTSPFFHQNGLHLSLLLCSALELPQNMRNRKKKSLCWVISPSLSCMVFLEVFLVAAQSAAVDFNHAEVIQNSHDYCQFSSHTSFAKTSIKTIWSFNFYLGKL